MENLLVKFNELIKLLEGSKINKKNIKVVLDYLFCILVDEYKTQGLTLNSVLNIQYKFLQENYNDECGNDTKYVSMQLLDDMLNVVSADWSIKSLNWVFKKMETICINYMNFTNSSIDDLNQVMDKHDLSNSSVKFCDRDVKPNTIELHEILFSLLLECKHILITKSDYDATLFLCAILEYIVWRFNKKTIKVRFKSKLKQQYSSLDCIDDFDDDELEYLCNSLLKNINALITNIQLGKNKKQLMLILEKYLMFLLDRYDTSIQMFWKD